MKSLLAILLPVAYIWASSYVGGEVLPDRWAANLDTHWWTLPAYITFFVLGLLSLVPLLVVGGTRSDYDEYP